MRKGKERKGKDWVEEQGRASASSSLALQNRSERGIWDMQFLLFSILLRIVLTLRIALLNGEQLIEYGVVEMDVWGKSEHGRHHIVQKTARNRPLVISNLELLQSKFMTMFWIYMPRILASSERVRRRFQLETVTGIE